MIIWLNLGLSLIDNRLQGWLNKIWWCGVLRHLKSRRGVRRCLWRKTEITQSSLVSTILISHPPPPPALLTTNIYSRKKKSPTNFGEIVFLCHRRPFVFLLLDLLFGKYLQTVNYCQLSIFSENFTCFYRSKIRKIPKLGTSPRILVPWNLIWENCCFATVKLSCLIKLGFHFREWLNDTLGVIGDICHGIYTAATSWSHPFHVYLAFTPFQPAFLGERANYLQ